MDDHKYFEGLVYLEDTFQKHDEAQVRLLILSAETQNPVGKHREMPEEKFNRMFRPDKAMAGLYRYTVELEGIDSQDVCHFQELGNNRIPVSSDKTMPKQQFFLRFKPAVAGQHKASVT